MNDELPWGYQPYDLKTPAEIVDDYVLVRGDLSEEYARRQLALVIERHIAAAERRGWRDALTEAAEEIERGKKGSVALSAFKVWCHEWWVTIRFGSPLTRAGRELRRNLRDDPAEYVEVERP